MRKAIAQIIDRDAIATNVYKGTVKPLYSTVPAAFPGAKESFKDAFGDPDPAKAKAILEEAGITTPVDARRLVHPDPLRAGRGRSLERDQAPARGAAACSRSTSTRPSGISTRRRPSSKGTYYFYGLGWFPDYPDADNYLHAVHA